MKREKKKHTNYITYASKGLRRICNVDTSQLLIPLLLTIISAWTRRGLSFAQCIVSYIIFCRLMGWNYHSFLSIELKALQCSGTSYRKWHLNVMILSPTPQKIWTNNAINKCFMLNKCSRVRWHGIYQVIAINGDTRQTNEYRTKRFRFHRFMRILPSPQRYPVESIDWWFNASNLKLNPQFYLFYSLRHTIFLNILLANNDNNLKIIKWHLTGVAQGV